LPWDDDVPDEGRPAEEVLGQVLQRGRQLRRRHRLAVRATGAIAVVTCMLGVVAAVSVAGPGPARTVRAAGTPTTSPSVPETTTEAPTTAVPQTTTTMAKQVVPAHRPTTTTTAAPTGSIFGFVEEKGLPAPDSRMQLYDSDWRQLGEMMTGADGRYRFDGLIPGQYRLTRTTKPQGGCGTSGVCISAIRMEERDISLSAGERHEEDFRSSPPPSTTTTSTTRPS
jgi:hypothetical protein